ncbi:MAG: histidine kinase dimerization/phospho-acceptor domain-containing protein [Verrucomicrobiota bacterium]
MSWPLLIPALAACAALFWFQHWRLRRRFHEELAGAGRDFAERFARQQREAEARSQARQQTLFNSMIEGVLWLDAEGRVQWANDSLRKGCGLAENLRGQTLMEVFRSHELAALSERLPREKIISGVELDLQRGDRRSWQISAALVSDPPGGPQGQLFVFHDVTRLKQLESIRKEFVGNVSHELRTPLSLIKGFAQTLLDGALRDPEQAARFLQKIDKHSDRLLFLIEDLLAISRLESGQIALNFQQVSLRDTAQRVVDDLAAPAAARRAALENRIPASLFDRKRHQIRQARGPRHPRRPRSPRAKGRGLRLRRRSGNTPRGHRAHLRAVLPGGPRAFQRERRHGPGPGHCQTYCSGPRRRGRGQK